jgi:NCAIR mutase (PurE)-related protein
LLPVPAQLFQGSLLLGGLAKLGLGSGESSCAPAAVGLDAGFGAAVAAVTALNMFCLSS